MILFPASNGCHLASFFALYVGPNKKKGPKNTQACRKFTKKQSITIIDYVYQYVQYVHRGSNAIACPCLTALTANSTSVIAQSHVNLLKQTPNTSPPLFFVWMKSRIDDSNCWEIDLDGRRRYIYINILNRIYYVAAEQSYGNSCKEERRARPVGNGLRQSLQALTVQQSRFSPLSS